MRPISFQPITNQKGHLFSRGRIGRANVYGRGRSDMKDVTKIQVSSVLASRRLRILYSFVKRVLLEAGSIIRCGIDESTNFSFSLLIFIMLQY